MRWRTNRLRRLFLVWASSSVGDSRGNCTAVRAGRDKLPRSSLAIDGERLGATVAGPGQSPQVVDESAGERQQMGHRYIEGLDPEAVPSQLFLMRYQFELENNLVSGRNRENSWLVCRQRPLAAPGST